MSARVGMVARVRDDLEVATRTLAAAGLAGVLVGVPAGLLGRLAMKVSAVAAGPSSQGVHTENGNVVGAFTADGTLSLVIFAGILPAVVGAILYAAVRPWFLSIARWRGVVFGAYLLALAGPVGLNPGNNDFSRFGPAPLNVAMFAALFFAVGIALVPVTEGTRAALSRGRVGLVALGFLIAGFIAGASVIIAVATVWLWLTGQLIFGANAALTLVAVSAAIGLVARRRGVSVLSYAALAAPLAFGLWLTGNAVVALLR